MRKLAEVVLIGVLLAQYCFKNFAKQFLIYIHVQDMLIVMLTTLFRSIPEFQHVPDTG